MFDITKSCASFKIVASFSCCDILQQRSFGDRLWEEKQPENQSHGQQDLCDRAGTRTELEYNQIVPSCGCSPHMPLLPGVSAPSVLLIQLLL